MNPSPDRPRPTVRRHPGRQVPVLRCRWRPLALAAASLFLPGGLWAAGPALPSGLQVVQGQASVSTQGATMTVSNSANALLNWQQFSIGAGRAVHFAQPAASSKVLNRVVGSDPSTILGSLSSNGQVWLLNPHGVLFGAGARVDVAGLVASTLRISDADWQAGRLQLGGSADGAFGGNASIVNQGELRSTSGGQLMLIGGAGVRNEGLIEAPDGQVLLAAGSSVLLVDSALPRLGYALSAPQGEVLNLGQLQAGSGRIDLQAALVNQQGIVRADGLASGPGGAVLITGSQGVQLAAASQTSASGGSGGRVVIDAGSGSLLAAGSIAATGSAGRGGSLTLQGRQIGLLDGALADASGASGGGSLRVGGGLQGRDTSVRHAEASYLAPGASLRADATLAGDGGLVVLWGDRATRAYGSLSARGGPAGGNGGLIETSGGWLDAQPKSVRADAPAGRAGTWLIDPYDLVIADTSENIDVSAGPDFSATGAQAMLGTSSIVAALNQGNSVSVTTGGDGSPNGYGHILMSEASISADPKVPVTLALKAVGNIDISYASIASQGAPLTVTLEAGKAGGNVDPAGTAPNAASGGAVMLRSSSIGTRGGDIVIGGPSVPCGPALGCVAAHAGAVAGGAAANAGELVDGIAVWDSTLDARGGRIALSGHTLYGNGGASGVAIVDSQLRAAQIDILGTADASGIDQQRGVLIDASTLVADQRLAIDGKAHTRATAFYFTQPRGVSVQGGSSLQIGLSEGSPTATMLISGVAQVLDGTGQPTVQPTESSEPIGLGSGIGVSIVDSNVRLKALGGAAIEIVGEERSTTPGIGLYFDSGAETAIDASQGRSLILRSPGPVLLAGAVKVPDNGLFKLDAGTLLSVEHAAISGAAREVQISGETVSIGVDGDPTSLVFGDSTTVAVKARQLVIGTNDDGEPVDQESERFNGSRQATQGAAGAVPQQQALSLRQPLQLSPPEAQVLLAAGGAIRIDADAVFLGSNAVLYSAATGTAIDIGGLAPQTSTLVFLNQGDSQALATPNGRWLLFAQQAAEEDGNVQTGGLVPGFLQFGATRGATAPAQGGNGMLFSSQPQLTLSDGGLVRKVYDGNTSVDLDSRELSVGGLLPGHAVVGELRFADKNVGSDKLLLPVAGAGGNTVVTEGGIPVYGYGLDAATMRGSISPRPLTLAAVTVAPKTYDGGTRASVGSWTLAGVLEGDQVRVEAGSARFSNAGVGSAKAVSAQVSALGGADAGNYSAIEVVANTTSAITPATLVYEADPVVVPQGQPLPRLTGTVSGFVSGETQASATQGQLRFDALLPANAGPGLYAIQGGGLSAANYGFVQAPGNQGALVVRPTQVKPSDLPFNTLVTVAAVAEVLLPALSTSAASGRLLDGLSALMPDRGQQPTFAGLDLDRLSESSLAAVLAARDAYKKAVFEQALAELERNPAAADAPGCASPQQAASGQCLVVAPLGGGLDISNARVVERAPIAVPAAPAVPAAAPVMPAPAPAAVATGPAPAAAAVAPAAARQAAARVAAVPADLSVNLPPRRPVALATLPQIQRKIAVVIGIDQYRDARIPRLSNAVADARAVAAEFSQRLGYETLVLENASRATIFRALNQLTSQVGPADSVVLYYAGHGELSEKTGLGYWQPADADAGRPETWIANADIDRVLRLLPASQLALISDSCFSGGLVGGERIRGVSAAQDPAALLGRRAAVVMTSGGNEPVFDTGANGHSPFANSLMQSLRQVGGWKPGSSLYEQVRFAVARKLPQRPQYGAARDAGHEPGADYVFEQRQLQSPAP